MRPRAAVYCLKTRPEGGLRIVRSFLRFFTYGSTCRRRLMRRLLQPVSKSMNLSGNRPPRSITGVTALLRAGTVATYVQRNRHQL